MIIDLNTTQNVNNLVSDIVIVGAGAVGITLAVTLTRAGKKVLLLESGGSQFEQKSQELNLFKLSGKHHNGILDGRARVVGGSTTLWGGQLVPFSEIDFKKRDWIPNSGWPISFKDLAPYYKKTADLLGLVAKYSDDDNVWKSLNIEEVSLGPNVKPFLTRWMKETNIFQIFKEEIENSDNMTLVKHAITTGFECGISSDVVSEIIIYNSNNREFKISTKNIVIACGTIEASRLMLFAAEKNENLPWKNNKYVGAFFQDHLNIQIAKVLPINKKLFSQAFDNIFIGGRKYQPKLRLSEEFQKKSKCLNIASSFIFDSSFSDQLSNVKIFARSLLRGSVPENWRNLPQHIKTIFSIFVPMAIRYIKDRRVLNFSDRGIYLNLHCEQVPVMDSRITLDWSKLDSANMPATDLNWKIDSREISSMSYFCIELDRQLRSKGLAKLEMSEKLKALDKDLIESCIDTNHQCGGLKMALSENEGVVDKNLKVFGTKNVYIAGAATFPTSSFANSTFTAMSLGLRLADELLAREGES
jgi:hypothetical protein